MENKNQEEQEGELHLDETKLEESTASAEEVAEENELSQEQKLSAEVGELKEKYLRLYSDFENFRKSSRKRGRPSKNPRGKPIDLSQIGKNSRLQGFKADGGLDWKSI